MTRSLRNFLKVRSRAVRLVISCGLLGPALPVGAQEDTPVLGEVTVTAPSGAGYRAEEAVTSTRIDAPLIETPQSVQVVTRELLEDRTGGGARLSDVLGTASGVNAFSGYCDFVFRGFRNNGATWNGMTVPGGAGFFHFCQSLANVERVEVMKGPVSLLYSSGQPGGAFNIVTKRPQASTYREVQAYAGRYNLYGASVDATGPLDTAHTLLYRVNAAWEDSDSFRDFQYTKTEFLAPALTWQLSPATTLDLELEYYRDRRRASYERGIPAPGGRLGLAPVSLWTSEPTDRSESWSATGYAALAHALDPTLTLHLKLLVNKKPEEASEHNATKVTDGGIVSRRYSDGTFTQQGYTVNAYGAKTLTFGDTRHQVLFGADAGYNKTSWWSRYARSGIPDLDMFNPVYRQAPVSSYTFRDPTSETGTSDYRALYLQDFAELSPRWRALAGLRYETHDQRMEQSTAPTTSSDDTALIPRAGLLYLLRPDLSLYASYSRSFQPQSWWNTPDMGGPFDPEYGSQWEAGAKYDALGGALSVTGTLYHITKKNVLVSDPDDPNGLRYLQTGEVESQGLELDVNGKIMPNWKINATYAYNDVEIVKGEPSVQGKRLENAPPHQAGVFTRYDFTDSTGTGTAWGAGLGAKYVGGDRRDFGGVVVLPAYTVVNAALYFEPLDAFDLALNIDNVTDKTHYTGIYNSAMVFPGSPRTFRVTARYRF